MTRRAFQAISHCEKIHILPRKRAPPGGRKENSPGWSPPRRTESWDRSQAPTSRVFLRMRQSCGTYDWLERNRPALQEIVFPDFVPHLGYSPSEDASA